MLFVRSVLVETSVSNNTPNTPTRRCRGLLTGTAAPVKVGNSIGAAGQHITGRAKIAGLHPAGTSWWPGRGQTGGRRLARHRPGRLSDDAGRHPGCRPSLPMTPSQCRSHTPAAAPRAAQCSGHRRDGACGEGVAVYDAATRLSNSVYDMI